MRKHDDIEQARRPYLVTLTWVVLVWTIALTLKCING